MDKHVQRYQRIVNNLVKKSFPELKGKKILIFNFEFSKKYRACVEDLLMFQILIVNPKITKKLSNEGLKAILSHELSHLSIIENMNIGEKIVFAFKWVFSGKTRIEFETSSDKLTIERGYGRGLLNAALVAEKGKTKQELEKRYSHGYLSSKKIKSYLKNKK